MMSLARAYEIVSAVNARCLFTMELVDKVPPLADISLADMLEAKVVVEAANEAARTAPRAPGESYSIKMVPDDRLIAAAYCAEHYEITREAIVVVPATRRETFEFEKPCKALALLPHRLTESEGDDD